MKKIKSLRNLATIGFILLAACNRDVSPISTWSDVQKQRLLSLCPPTVSQVTCSCVVNYLTTRFPDPVSFANLSPSDPAYNQSIQEATTQCIK